MNPDTQKILSIAVTVLLLGGVGFYIYKDLGSTPEMMSATPMLQTTGTSTPSNNQSNAGALPEIAVNTSATQKPNFPHPDLDHKVLFSSDFPVEAKDIMRGKITDLQNILKKDPTAVNSWIGLGIRYKESGDYLAARDAWVYAAALAPENSILYYNLGILYRDYLKDYPKSEQNFLEAIKLFPGYPQTYEELADLYIYSYKQHTTAALDILMQGAKAVAGDINLLAKLGRYYRDAKNDSVNAKVYLEQARKAAVAAGNSQLASDFQSEIDALK